MMDPSAGLPSHWVAYFSVADTDAAVAAAVNAGGALQGDPMDTPFGGWHFSPTRRGPSSPSPDHHPPRNPGRGDRA